VGGNVGPMKTILRPLLATLAGIFRSRALLQLEILALRQQLAMITARDRKRLRFLRRERLFWVCCTGFGPALSRHCMSSRLAPQGLPPLLDLEIATARGRSSADRSRHP